MVVSWHCPGCGHGDMTQVDETVRAFTVLCPRCRNEVDVRVKFDRDPQLRLHTEREVIARND
jgi:transcription elongation factor Elf1